MQSACKKALQLLLVSALLVVLYACTTIDSKPEIPEVLEISESQQVQELAFEGENGRAIVVFEEEVADCIIYAKGLDPDEKYMISLVSDDDVSLGVTFGPLENVNIRVGSLEEEVMFRPNAEGELFVSMRNPIRIFTAAEEELYFRIESENGKVSMKTSSFVVNK